MTFAPRAACCLPTQRPSTRPDASLAGTLPVHPAKWGISKRRTKPASGSRNLDSGADVKRHHARLINGPAVALDKQSTES